YDVYPDLHSFPTRRSSDLGEGDWCVAEADESDGSFTRFFPDIAVVTNMNLDHMDHYGAEAELFGAFMQFINNIKPEGLAVLCVEDRKSTRLNSSHVKISYA